MAQQLAVSVDKLTISVDQLSEAQQQADTKEEALATQ